MANQEISQQPIIQPAANMDGCALRPIAQVLQKLSKMYTFVEDKLGQIIPKKY